MGNKTQRPVEIAALTPVYLEGAEFEEIDGMIHITAFVVQPDLHGVHGDVEKVAVSRWMIPLDKFWGHSHAVKQMTRPKGGREH